MDFRIFLVELGYFVAVVLFIVGLRRMSSLRDARSGLPWAAWGMTVGIGVTFFWPDLSMANLILIAMAAGAGGAVAWYLGRKAAEASLPRMVALCNGMGGGAAGAIAAAQLIEGGLHSLTATLLAVLAGLIGSASFAASLVVFAKDKGWIPRPVRFRSQHQVNGALLLLAAIVGLMLLGDYPGHGAMAAVFFLLALLAGALFTLPVEATDLPPVVCFHNALIGLAVALDGFVLDNAAMIIAGTLVAAAATLLVQRIGAAMQRPLGTALFGASGPTD